MFLPMSHKCTALHASARYRDPERKVGNMLILETSPRDIPFCKIVP
jgi:hypothetical protein